MATQQQHFDTPPPSIHLVAAGARADYLPLLLVGDEDPQQVVQYLDSGWLFAARVNADLAAVALVVPLFERTAELKNIAVAARYRRRGLGSRLMRTVESTLARDFAELQVGTGDADVQNHLFYLHNGFRFAAIRKDFFRDYAQPIWANGLRLQDMVVFAKPLTGHPRSLA